MSNAPPTRVDRRGRVFRRRRAAAALACLLVLGGATAAALWAADRDADGDSGKPGAAPAATNLAKRPSAPVPLRLVARPAGTLAAPVQDGAAVRVAHRLLLLGGLDSADTSTADVRVVANRRGQTIARLPGAFHDGAAVSIGGVAYEFGGGDGVRQLDGIFRVDPVTGGSRRVGRLPAPSSDHAAAVVAGTAYVVGGYTGTSWLDTIVAWRPGDSAHVVGRLPSPVRYAAVTAAGGLVVVAGGSMPNGTASRAVYTFDPHAHAVNRIGLLPSPTTHAAAASMHGEAVVVGGRSAAADTPTRRIVAIDPVRHRIRLAGSLAEPLSDAAAVAGARSILVIGGRSGATTAAVTRLVRAGPRVRRFRLHTAKTVNVYAHDGANALSPIVRRVPQRVYVPNSASNTVDVIDQRTFKIVAHYPVGALPQHVTPSYDLKTLWVDNDAGNSLTPVSPITGRPKGRSVHVADPYNLYFTPGGRYAIVVAEREGRLDFRYAHTMRLHRAVRVPCRGVDHMDFSANGRFALASCEFSGQMVYIDVRRERIVRVLNLPHGGAMPQDVKLSPDGRVYYVADMASNGVWEVDARRVRVIGFLHTGAGAHGLYPNRDAKLLYITNRAEGSISVLDFATRRLIAKWHVGGSPDMGGVSADGKVLWLSGRYNAEVYAISTKDGHVLARIPVGYEPHGLCVWPQPGRYSLGHTGILR